MIRVCATVLAALLIAIPAHARGGHKGISHAFGAKHGTTSGGSSSTYSGDSTSNSSDNTHLWTEQIPQKTTPPKAENDYDKFMKAFDRNPYASSSEKAAEKVPHVGKLLLSLLPFLRLSL